MASDAPLLDRAKLGPKLDLVTAIVRARKAGRPFARQIADIVRLGRRPMRLTGRDYYRYRLYDPRLTDAERRAFLGERGQAALFVRLTDPGWVAAAHDKLLYYTVMAGLGHAVPRVLALHHAQRRYPGAERLADGAAVGRFLRQAAYPLFGKPVTGRHSVGTVSLTGYDPTTERVRVSAGAEAGVEAFIAELAPFARDGYLFQERLTAHPFVREACGDRIATVRFIVLLGPDGPLLLRALWKVPAGAHVADNFWRHGNCLAALDRDTGRVIRVVQGIGHAQRELEAHPDTGFRLVGAVMPDWAATTKLVLEAATAFAGVVMQGWDVALTERGPLLLELNIGGDVDLPQYAFGQGIYQGALVELDASRR